MIRRRMPTFRLETIATSLIAFVVLGHPASAEEQKSWINVPIRISLPALEERLNAAVPKRLVTINQRMVCVEAVWIKTKIPVGIEFYDTYKTRTKYEWLKTKVTPEISCDVSGFVDLNGRIRIGGSGGTLDIAVPVAAQVSAEAAGISETANAQAVITGAITPVIDENWKVTAELKPDLVWNQRPELRLFNIIKITITGEVEPKLREELAKFANNLPALLAELDLKGKASAVWDKLQDPVILSADGPVYLLFAPESVGFSGINVAEDALTASVAISGIAKVVAGDAPSATKRPLANLAPIPQDAGGFRFILPVDARLAAISEVVAEKFPDGHTVTLDEGPLEGSFTLDDLKLTGTADGRLSIAVDVVYENRSRFWQLIDIFDWFDTSGTLRFTARPMIVPMSRTLQIEDLTLEAGTDNRLADSLIAFANLPLVRDFLADTVTHDFGTDLDAAIASANTALNRDLGEGLTMTGSIASAEISDLRVTEDRITVRAKASGLVAIALGNP